ncbi:MAG: hypothetical protein ACKPEN_04220, partial [Planktothrix sp.]|uniref:hypothetical protein n=1 Tax=Planktothrix sp. TaxID=3088171 RepID=UPI0038D4C86D
MQNLAKQLNISETELLIAIKQMGLNPSEVDESWEPAIAQHLTGNKPTALNGKPPEIPKQPESFSINDSEDFINWEDIENELGDGALTLVNELGLEPEAITRSDLAAL